MIELHRHTLLWARGDGGELRGERRSAEAPAARETLARWLAAGWPFVVRQRSSWERSDRLAVGMPLPPAWGKARVFLDVDPPAILRWARPPSLDEIIERLPSIDAAPLRRLAHAGRGAGIELRVFGSCAFEAITGMSYLTPESDVDLLWRPRNAAELERGTALLAAWEKSEGRRADGEILFADPAGRELGVSWREWATARSGRVLVKTLLGARLCEMRDLRSLLPRSATEAMPCASFWP